LNSAGTIRERGGSSRENAESKRGGHWRGAVPCLENGERGGALSECKLSSAELHKRERGGGRGEGENGEQNMKSIDLGEQWFCQKKKRWKGPGKLVALKQGCCRERVGKQATGREGEGARRAARHRGKSGKKKKYQIEFGISRRGGRGKAVIK